MLLRLRKRVFENWVLVYRKMAKNKLKPYVSEILPENCSKSYFYGINMWNQTFLSVFRKKNFFWLFFDFSSMGVSMKKIENFRFFKISLKTCFLWFSYTKNTILMLKKFEINVKKWVLVYFRYNLGIKLAGHILAISFYRYFKIG